MPIVSVLLTSFNHENYVREAIESVLNQSYSNFELIILDDCSSDNSWSIINSYDDPRIKSVRSQEPGQVVCQLNKTIADIARGEYIAIHHSDDVWEPHKLEAQVAFLAAHPDIGAVLTLVQVINEHGDSLAEQWFEQENHSQAQWLNMLFLEKNHLCHPSALVRKKCYMDVGLFRYGLLQTGDAEMWSRLLFKYPIHVIQDRLTKHRRFSDESSSSGNRIDVEIRMSSEWNFLRENFLSINDYEQIVGVFPRLERFRSSKGFDCKFLLAMACLYETEQRGAWQLGLRWLFELLNGAQSQDRIRELYGFSYRDFYTLTEKFDVYGIRTSADLQVVTAKLGVSVAECGVLSGDLRACLAERDALSSRLRERLAEHDERVANFDQRVAEFEALASGLRNTVASLELEIANLRASLSWKITAPLRRLRQLNWRVANVRYFFAPRDGKSASFRDRHFPKDLVQEPGKLPADFNADVYLKLNPDLAVAGVDPGWHYLHHGRDEGRVYTVAEMRPSEEPGKLPADFDADVYLKLNPDLAVAGVDPGWHYLHHGRGERRACALPDMTISGGHDFKVERDTVLVVSHEASRSGAPILSLNIVSSLARSHNVVALILGGGPLGDSFQQAGAAVLTSPNLRGYPVLAELAVGRLCDRFDFKFAIVNSVESRVVLPALSCRFVPTVTLIHEFASCYTRPHDVLGEACFWSSELVFSANMIFENARVEYPEMFNATAHILPQGRCVLPSGDFGDEQMIEERKRIRDLIRPPGILDDSLVIMGAGYVQFRKGVDIFIECASRVCRTAEGRKCRFVWIGKGYDPDNDAGYSVYLEDQIRRSGLQEHVFFVDETPAIETAYEEADLLLLSSRLDPLPNVAIDAMAHGVPVLCFDKTTGIADFLIESGLRDQCVAAYLDTADMAEKILALASSQIVRTHVADRSRSASVAYFDMTEYVERLELLAAKAFERTQQEKTDVQTILDSGLFRKDFTNRFLGEAESIERQIRTYVRAWASGIERRDTFPRFLSDIYLEQHGVVDKNANPFADYLRNGRPKGPWLTKVLESNVR